MSLTLIVDPLRYFVDLSLKYMPVVPSSVGLSSSVVGSSSSIVESSSSVGLSSSVLRSSTSVGLSSPGSVLIVGGITSTTFKQII